MKINLDTSIWKCEFTARTFNCLNSEGITTVKQLIRKNPKDLLKIPNLGKKSFNEIEQFLEQHNLSFGVGFDVVKHTAVKINHITEDYTFCDVNNLELTFDGQTGQLISAKVLK